MKNSLNIEIISVDGYLFQGQSHQVVIPASEGDIGILPEHESLITELREGKIQILDSSDKLIKEIDVKSGTAEIFGDVRILIDS